MIFEVYEAVLVLIDVSARVITAKKHHSDHHHVKEHDKKPLEGHDKEPPSLQALYDVVSELRDQYLHTQPNQGSEAEWMLHWIDSFYYTFDAALRSKKKDVDVHELTQDWARSYIQKKPEWAGHPLPEYRLNPKDNAKLSGEALLAEIRRELSLSRHYHFSFSGITTGKWSFLAFADMDNLNVHVIAVTGISTGNARLRRFKSQTITYDPRGWQYEHWITAIREGADNFSESTEPFEDVIGTGTIDLIRRFESDD